MAALRRTRDLKGPIRDVAVATAFSQNGKIGTAAATMAAQVSCPKDCVFINGGGCYAEDGGAGFITEKLNVLAEERGTSALEVAKVEAAAIDGIKARRGRPMRLHTVGDCATDATARIVAAASERYMIRGGGQVWTYTHAWRRVARRAWGTVSVLASCESVKDVRAAWRRGYAASIVVPEFRSREAYMIDGVKVVPCPAQTTDNVTCSSCGLCMDSYGLLERRTVIGFAVHGGGNVVKRALAALDRPDDPRRRLSSRDVLYEIVEEQERWPSESELGRVAGCSPSSARQMIARVRAELAG